MDDGMTRAMAPVESAPVESGHLSGGRRLAVAGVALVTLAVAVFAVGRGIASNSGGSATATGSAASTASGSGTPATIAGFAFSPETVTVKVGGAVTWTNKDSSTHSVKSADGSFVSQDLQDGQAFTASFKTAGTFAYVCGIHAFMKGTVVVQP
jgi:plastocyanin